MKTPTALDLPMADPLPEAKKKYFDVCREKLGMVPNVLQAYAFDIDKLNAFTTFYNDLMLGNSGLSKLEREMIAVVVSSINRCFYCLIVTVPPYVSLSGNPILGEQLVMNYKAVDLPPKQRAMLDFAALLTTASATVAESDCQTLRDHGFNDRDIWDITSVAAFFNMTNRVASGTAMVNEEYHSRAR